MSLSLVALIAVAVILWLRLDEARKQIMDLQEAVTFSSAAPVPVEPTTDLEDLAELRADLQKLQVDHGALGREIAGFTAEWKATLAESARSARSTDRQAAEDRRFIRRNLVILLHQGGAAIEELHPLLDDFAPDEREAILAELTGEPVRPVPDGPGIAVPVTDDEETGNPQGSDPAPESADGAGTNNGSLEGAEHESIAPPGEPEEDFVVYTVKRGDMLSVIAAKHGVSTQTILEANNIKNPNLIGIGAKLKIPLKE